MTYGLTHIDLAVRDPERSCAFYEALFGMVVWKRHDNGNIVVTTPGARDLIQFTRAGNGVAIPGPVQHLGFCVRAPEEIDEIVRRALAVGGTIVEHRDLSTGKPYAKVRDPDGYDLEIYDIPQTN